MSADTGERYGHDLQDEARTVQWCAGGPEAADRYPGVTAPEHEFDAGNSTNARPALCHEVFQRLWPPPRP